jgi:hypothetical protein
MEKIWSEESFCDMESSFCGSPEALTPAAKHVTIMAKVINDFWKSLPGLYADMVNSQIVVNVAKIFIFFD